MIEERIDRLEQEVRVIKEDVAKIKEMVIQLDNKINQIALNEFSHVEAELKVIRRNLNTLFSWKYRLKSDLATGLIVAAIVVLSELLLKLGGV